MTVIKITNKKSKKKVDSALEKWAIFLLFLMQKENKK